MEEVKTNQGKEKDLIVRLGPASRVLAESVLSKANTGKQFKKKINFKDVFEHLLNTYGEISIPDLIKMRELPEDKLKMRYINSGSKLDYHDWIERQMTKLDEIGKKSSKRRKTEDKSVS